MRKKSILYKTPDRLSIREKIGAAQEEYASFCRISKSLLSMIEINQRDWPLLKSDMEIVKAFYEAEKQNPDISSFEKLLPDQINTIEIRLLKLKGECFQLERQLERMVFIYQQALKMLKTCTLLRPKFTDPNTIQFKIITYWESDAKLKLSQKNQTEQELLQIQIAGLMKQIAVLERKIV